MFLKKKQVEVVKHIQIPITRNDAIQLRTASEPNPISS